MGVGRWHRRGEEGISGGGKEEGRSGEEMEGYVNRNIMEEGVDREGRSKEGTFLLLPRAGRR